MHSNIKLDWRNAIVLLLAVATLAVAAVACGEREEAPEAAPELERQQVVEGINALLKEQSQALMSGDWEKTYASFADECREAASLEEHRATHDLIRRSVLAAGVTSVEPSVLEVSSIRGNRAIVVVQFLAKSDGKVREEYSATEPNNEYVLEGGTWKDANCESIR